MGAQNQPPPASNGASEEALRRAQMSLRSLKKELREAQESRDDAMKRAAQQCEDSDALDSKWKNTKGRQGWCIAEAASRAHKRIEDFARSTRNFKRESDSSRRRDEAGAGAIKSVTAAASGLAEHIRWG